MFWVAWFAHIQFHISNWILFVGSTWQHTEATISIPKIHIHFHLEMTIKIQHKKIMEFSFSHSFWNVIYLHGRFVTVTTTPTMADVILAIIIINVSVGNSLLLEFCVRWLSFHTMKIAYITLSLSASCVHILCSGGRVETWEIDYYLAWR